jgi:hypothetical protein
MIYETLPFELEISNKEIRLVRDFFIQNKGLTFSASEIAGMVGFPSGGTQVKLRKAITMLIEEYQMPITSNAKGFMFSDNEHFLIEYVNSLEARKNGLMRRINAVNNLIKRQKNDSQKKICVGCNNIDYCYLLRGVNLCRSCKKIQTS